MNPKRLFFAIVFCSYLGLLSSSASTDVLHDLSEGHEDSEFSTADDTEMEAGEGHSQDKPLHGSVTHQHGAVTTRSRRADIQMGDDDVDGDNEHEKMEARKAHGQGKLLHGSVTHQRAAYMARSRRADIQMGEDDVDGDDEHEKMEARKAHGQSQRHGSVAHQHGAVTTRSRRADIQMGKDDVDRDDEHKKMGKDDVDRDDEHKKMEAGEGHSQAKPLHGSGTRKHGAYMTRSTEVGRDVREPIDLLSSTRPNIIIVPDGHIDIYNKMETNNEDDKDADTDGSDLK